MPPARTGPRIYSRESVLLGCCATLILMIGFTAFINRLYHKKIHTLADNWAALGDASVKRGDVSSAIVEYRNALAYSPEKVEYQFHLAQALALTGANDNEAQNYLMNLWNESPGSGEVNLELARVAAHKPAGYADALRYYHTAIDGEWAENPVSRRWEVRQELCEYLLRTGRVEQARVEVMALADNTAADDVEHQLIVGQFLLRTQDWNRALNVFRPMAIGDRAGAEAIAGAGTAAFKPGPVRDGAGLFFQVASGAACDAGCGVDAGDFASGAGGGSVFERIERERSRPACGECSDDGDGAGAVLPGDESAEYAEWAGGASGNAAAAKRGGV